LSREKIEKSLERVSRIFKNPWKEFPKLDNAMHG
jgi:hypothetical protein